MKRGAQPQNLRQDKTGWTSPTGLAFDPVHRLLFAVDTTLAGILGYSDEELVSIDYLGDTRSAVIDGPLLALEGDRVLKVYAWYDNERGYVQRLADLIGHIARADGGARERR